MKIAAWNLNNRVGKVPFRLEAAPAAIVELGSHVLSPDLRNPSPVRHPEDVNSHQVNFFSVR